MHSGVDQELFSKGHNVTTSFTSWSCSTVGQQTADKPVCERAAGYKLALVKHRVAIKGITQIDVMDCLEYLCAEDYVSAVGVKESRATFKSSGAKEALSHLCTVVEDLSDEGICSFVENVLPLQGLSQLVETFCVCPGPGKCSLRPNDLHPAPECSIDKSQFAVSQAKPSPTASQSGQLKTGVRVVLAFIVYQAP